MAATNLQANWSPVSWNSVTFTKVQDCSFDWGGSLDAYSGDADRFDTVLTAFMTRPTGSITSGNTYQLMNLGPPGVATSSLIAVHLDAKLVASFGVQYTLANATFENARSNGPHGTWGTATASFKSFSSDGTTAPLSLARA
jgi:hypothetical protein